MKKNQKHHNTIIGTNPPCPRCKLLTDVITQKCIELRVDADIRHLTYTDEEAVEFAKDLGLEPGTAGLVAKKLGVEIDNTKKRTANFDSEFNSEYEDYNFSGWTYELDELLRPFELKAKEVGVLMTPTIVINNELKNQGSIPRLETLIHWLNELKSN